MHTRSIQFEITPPIWKLDELNTEESLKVVIVLQNQPCFKYREMTWTPMHME